MIHEIISNPVISGGAGLMLIGGLLATARSVPAKLFEWLKDHIFTTVEIDNTDPAFLWMKAWLAKHGKSRWLAAGVLDENAGISPQQPVQNEKPKFCLCPRGACTFRHRGHRIVGWLTKEQVSQSKEWRETIVLKAWCKPDFFRDVLNDAYEFSSGRDGSTVQVWVPDGNYWRLQARKPSRQLDSLILAEGVAESIIDDAQQFVQDEKWYRDMGIPYRRGYLAHGPPGTGKSSLAHVLAGKLRMNINVASLSSFFSDLDLTSCLSRVPNGHILLLEDIDATKREAAGQGASFSALLNAIDGLAAREGQILVMTTNHIERLDPALIRPGRADVKIFVGNANHDQASRMFLRFFPDNTEGAEAFAKAWEGQSVAEIQKHLMVHRDCPEEAISRGMVLAA